MRDTRTWVAIKGSVAVSAALLLNACEPVDGAAKPDAAGAQAVETTAAGAATDESRPAGAILFENDFYVVPMAVDREGCEQFRLWSGTQAVPLSQPIYYRDGEGSFSKTLSEEGSCNAELVEIGPDAEGCPTFNAVQPDGSSSDVPYYPTAKGSYTTNKERSTC